MKKTLLWLLPVVVIAVALALFLTHAENEGERGVAMQPSAPKTADKEAKSAAPELAKASEESPAAEDPAVQGTRETMAETVGKHVRGHVRWKGALPQGLAVLATSVAAIAGKTEFPGKIEPDGSFLIPLPDKFYVGSVRAEGDFHYSEPAELQLKEGKIFEEPTLTLIAGGRIRGQVLHPDRSPASDAKVLLSKPLDPGMWMDMEGKGLRVRTQHTDDKGNFVFRGVTPGKGRTLRASLSGFGPAQQENVDVRVLETVSPELTLAPECILAGKVLGPKEEAVEGVKVQAMLWQGMGGLMKQGMLQNEIESEITATSAADGSFRIGNLAAGKYRLLGKKAGFQSAFGNTIELKAGETKEAIQLKLGLGEAIAGKVLNAKGEAVAGVKLKLSPDWMSGEASTNAQWTGDTKHEVESQVDGSFRFQGLGKGAFVLEGKHEAEGEGRKERVKAGSENVELRLAPQGSVRGRVSAAGIGAPIGKFQVRATRQEAWMAMAVQIESFKDKDGIYQLKKLSPGSVTLSVMAEGFSPTKRSVEVKSGETLEGIDFELVPAVTIRGTVVAAGSNTPIEGADVGVANNAGPYAWVQERMNQDRVHAKSGPEGEFEITGLSAGKLSLRATHSDYAVGSSSPIEPQPGETLEGVVVTMSGGGGMDGFVFDEDGLPVSGATVFTTGMQSGTVKSGQTDVSGYFSFEKGLAPGQYQVVSMSKAPEGSADEEMNAQFMQGMKTAFVQVEEGKIARVMLGEKKEGGCRVVGHVMAGGKAVTGAYISVLPKTNGAQKEGVTVGTDLKFAMTDKNGEFTIPNVDSGKQTFSVQKGNFGGASMMQEVEIPASGEHRIEFVLPGGSISGRITDRRTGEPIQQMWVTSSPKMEGQNPNWAGGGWGQTQSDAEGNYRIDNVKPGIYQLSSGNSPFIPGGNKKGYGRASKTISLGDGQELRNADLALGPAAKVRGQVLRADGQPAAGAAIHFQTASGETDILSSAQTDAAGNFEYNDLGAGSYTAYAQLAGYITASQPLTAEEGGSTELHFVLKTGTQLTIKLLGKDGKALEGASFQVFDEKGVLVGNFAGMSELMKAWSGTQEAGSYSLGSVTPGTYRIIVTKDGASLLDTTVQVNAGPTQTIELKSGS